MQKHNCLKIGAPEEADIGKNVLYSLPAGRYAKISNYPPTFLNQGRFCSHPPTPRDT
jgi:hypothetical protein